MGKCHRGLGWGNVMGVQGWGSVMGFRDGKMSRRFKNGENVKGVLVEKWQWDQGLKSSRELD